MPNEDSLRHKYTPLPEEPRFKKKRKRVHVRSDHKHVYETVCVDDGGIITKHGKRFAYLHLVERCKVCGRIGDTRVMPEAYKPPKDMPFYELPDFRFLWDSKVLPEGMRVR